MFIKMCFLWEEDFLFACVHFSRREISFFLLFYFLWGTFFPKNQNNQSFQCFRSMLLPIVLITVGDSIDSIDIAMDTVSDRQHR